MYPGLRKPSRRIYALQGATPPASPSCSGIHALMQGVMHSCMQGCLHAGSWSISNQRATLLATTHALPAPIFLARVSIIFGYTGLGAGMKACCLACMHGPVSGRALELRGVSCRENKADSKPRTGLSRVFSIKTATGSRIAKLGPSAAF